MPFLWQNTLISLYEGRYKVHFFPSFSCAYPFQILAIIIPTRILFEAMIKSSAELFFCKKFSCHLFFSFIYFHEITAGYNTRTWILQNEFKMFVSILSEESWHIIPSFRLVNLKLALPSYSSTFYTNILFEFSFHCVWRTNMKVFSWTNFSISTSKARVRRVVGQLQRQCLLSSSHHSQSRGSGVLGL